MTSLLPVDVVVPVLNEAHEIAGYLDSLGGQLGGDGATLPSGVLRVIVVDSFSSDGTLAAIESARERHPQLEIVVLQEPPGSHVDARRRGAEFALAPATSGAGAILASTDVDTRFHPGWIADVGARFAAGTVDAVTYAGHYPATFWAQVPRLAARYFAEVGTVFFPPSTIAAYAFDADEALFRDELFRAFTRVPSDCAWAYSKAAYAAAGGYLRERRADGSEVMFEGRNLRFRLDRNGARVAYVDTTPFETSPRRLLFEAEQFLAGTAYSAGLVAIRGQVTAAHLAALEELASSLDFAALRSYVVKHYVLLPAVSRPALLDGNERFLGEAFEPVRSAILEQHAHLDGAAAVHALTDTLVERHGAAIVAAGERRRALRLAARG